jgi:ferric-dicitrate binding protein FerR (iron transport regulator)
VSRWWVLSPAEREETPLDPDDAAVFWVARERLGLLDPRSQESFRRWLSDSRNMRAYDMADAAVDATAAVNGIPDVTAMRDAALTMTPCPHSSAWRSVAVWAAIGVIALTSYLLHRL